MITPYKPITDGILYFTAPWCKPCQTMKPILEGLKSQVHLVSVDTDFNIAYSYNVQNLPTLLMLKDGEVIKSMVGAKSALEIKQFAGEL